MFSIKLLYEIVNEKIKIKIKIKIKYNQENINI
jgi:hypothetical protein